MRPVGTPGEQTGGSGTLAPAWVKMGLRTPIALEMDESNRLLVLDRGNAQVRIYRP
ncbi:MAG TPA: hypothetical protein VFP10_09480 [Candidatus Eisenbacteria bacterium]|nr:hypothetical protein [Candidatus Eisenbacteria bacterium]